MPSIARILAVLLLVSSTALAGPIVGSRSDPVTCVIGNTVYTAKELQTMKENGFFGFTDPEKTILRDCCAKAEATNSKGNDLNAATVGDADRKFSPDPSTLSPSTASDPKNAAPAFANAKTDINQSSPSSLFSDDVDGKLLSSADTPALGDDSKVAIKDHNTNQPASFSTSTTSTASASENPETVGTDQRASPLLSDGFSDPTISTASASKYPAANAKKVGAQSVPGSGKTDTPSSSLSPAVDDLSEAASAVAVDSNSSNRIDTGKSEQSLKGGKTSTSVTTNKNADPNNALNLAKAIESTSPAPTSDNVEHAAKDDAVSLQIEAPATEAPNVANGLADLLSSTEDDTKTDGQKAGKGLEAPQKPVEKQSAAQVTASESTTSDSDASGDVDRFATSTKNGAAADKKTANNSSFKDGSVPVTSGADKLATSNPTNANDPATEVVNPLIEDVEGPKDEEVAKVNGASTKCSCPL